MVYFFRFNANFHNSKAEKIIRDPPEKTMNQIYHAKARWPSTVEISLCPYVLQQANHIHKFLHDMDYGTSPNENFS